MNILSIDFVDTLMISGLMLILFRSRMTLQQAHVMLTENIRK